MIQNCVFCCVEKLHDNSAHIFWPEGRRQLFDEIELAYHELVCFLQTLTHFTNLAFDSFLSVFHQPVSLSNIVTKFVAHI